MIIVFLVFNKTNIIRLARAFLGVIISRKGQATVLFLIHPVPTQTFSARGLSRALYLAILINFKILNLGIDLSPANLEPIEPTTPIIPHLQDPFHSVAQPFMSRVTMSAHCSDGGDQCFIVQCNITPWHERGKMER
jgi:hypothetical protein